MLPPAGRSQDGRRFVPPGKRPSAGVAASKGRERPRPRPANAAPGPTGGVAHAPMSVSECAGARVRSAVGMLCEDPGERQPEFLRRTNSRVASLRPRFSRGCASLLSRSESRLVCRRSGSQFSGRAWARQGSASPLRALDPPGALPDASQLPERRARARFDSWLAHQPSLTIEANAVAGVRSSLARE